MKKESFNALFVISQSVDFQEIMKVTLSNKYNSIFILSTYFLFPQEEERLQKLLPKIPIRIKSFDGFLDEKTMLAIDHEAHEKYAATHPVNPDTNYIFLENLVYLKNKAIHTALLSEFAFGKIHFWGTGWVRLNLGISLQYWREQNGKNEISNSFFWKKRLSRYFQKNPIGRFVRSIILYFQMLFQSRTAWILKWENENFIFHSLRRLKFEDDVNFKKINYRGIRFFKIFSKNNASKILERFTNSLKLKGNTRLASPLHQYAQLYDFTKKPHLPVLIFVDGYRPSNYPPYAYVYYFVYGDFVSRDQYDFELKTKSNRTAIKPFPFLKKSYFEIPKLHSNTDTNTIILSLNHAGDWSSLVDRTDTDKLIFSFCKFSQQYPSKKFIVRMHPTMVLPRHEGKDSKIRIEKLIQAMGYKNLSVSKVSLEEDWERGDVFVSEYSLSALDAMRFGKICLFVNLTRRRSFVQDFVDLGFPIANSEDDFYLKMKDIFTNPIPYQKQQIKAAKRYNSLLEDFLV